MTTYVCLLRGVNVAGHRKVGMEELRSHFSSVGFSNVRTYIQSANVVFDHSKSSAQSLARKIEDRLKHNLGTGTAAVLRTREQMERVVQHNPYSKKDESRVHVIFLKNIVRNFPAGISSATAAGELFTPFAEEIYLFLPNGSGRTKLSNSFFEKTLGVTATMRNWRTTKYLFSMMDGSVKEE